MPLIEIGKKAPAFTLKDQDGKAHKLSDYERRPVVLYFYPKDDTPGCTAEACAFRDNLVRFKPGKALILGVSVLDVNDRLDRSVLLFPTEWSLQYVERENPGVKFLSEVER